MHIIFVPNCGTYHIHNMYLLLKLLNALKQTWYFVSKIVLTYPEKKLFLWSRDTFEMQDLRLRICKKFQIPWSFYWNSATIFQTEHFFYLVPGNFSNLKSRTILIQIGKIIGLKKPTGKVRNFLLHYLTKWIL